MRNKSLLERNFELQIKTLLQEAWWRVDHDIVYKGKDISWGHERVSGQLRALLDLADGVLAQLEQVGDLLHRQADQANSDYKLSDKEIILMMEKRWEKKDDLPKDKKRMAQIIQRYLDLAHINVEELKNILEQAETEKNEILSKRALNPIQKVFIIVFQQYEEAIKKALENSKYKVLLTQEMIDYCPPLKRLTTGVIYID